MLDDRSGISYFAQYQVTVANDPGKNIIKVVGYPSRKLAECFQAEPVELVFVAMPAEQQGRTVDVLNTLSGFVTDVCFVPDMPAPSLLRRQVSLLGALPIVSLTHTPQEG